MYLPVLLRHSLVNWWEHFFSDIRRYLFSLKQVVHVGANNSPLLLFSPKIDVLDKLLSLPSTGFSCRFITSSWTGGSKLMFGGFMLAAICFWYMIASGGAFNPGTAVVCCETFASPHIIVASWAAFTSGSVVVWAMFASTENALHFGVHSIISWGSRTFLH